MIEKFIKLLIISVIISLSFITEYGYCQWQPDIRLTNNSGSRELSNNNSKCVASNGNTIHVVWSDSRDGNTEIYYKKSTDGGINWGADIRLTNDPAVSRYPSIAIYGSNIHIVWHDERFNREIYYKRSTDGGMTWGTDIRLTNNIAGSWYPSISVAGQTVSVVWQDERNNSANNIFYKCSTNNGDTWGLDTHLTDLSSNSTYVSVSSFDSVVHVAWKDERNATPNIFYCRSTNNGLTWQGEINLSNNNFISDVPSISVSGSNVHVSWSVWFNYNSYICYKRSTNSGINWLNTVILTNETSFYTNPNIFSSGSNVHIILKNDSAGIGTLYYFRSSNNGANWSSLLPVTNNNSMKNRPSIIASEQAVHVVWMDNRGGNYEIYYKNNPTANVLINNISSELPLSFNLSQNYPNPFNPVTKINYALPKQGFVTMKIYDITGRERKVLVNEFKQAGYYTVDFNGSNLASGVYFYRIQSNDFIHTKRMVLIK